MASNIGEAMGGVTTGPAGHSMTMAKNPQTRKLSRVTIEPTDNGGFMVTEEYDAPKSKDGMSGYEKPVKKAAKDLQGLDSILDDCLGLSSAYPDKGEGDGGGDAGAGAADAAGAAGAGDAGDGGASGQ